MTNAEHSLLGFEHLLAPFQAEEVLTLPSPSTASSVATFFFPSKIWATLSSARTCSWLCVKEWFLRGLRGTLYSARIEPGLATCRASAFSVPLPSLVSGLNPGDWDVLWAFLQAQLFPLGSVLLWLYYLQVLETLPVWLVLFWGHT